MGDTYDRIYSDSYGVNGPRGLPEENHRAIELLCDALDESNRRIEQLESQQRDDRVQYVRDYWKIERSIEELAKLLHDEAPIIARFAQFLKD